MALAGETGDLPRVVPMGLGGILVQLSDRLDDAANRRALALAARIEAEVGTGALAGVEEAAPSLGSVFLRLDPLRADRVAITGRIAELLKDAAGQGTAPSRRWTIPVAFGGAGGPDLDAVAAELGCSAQAAVEDLTAQDLRVMAIGFAPGLPYMGILPDRWDIPRKAGLTPNVPAAGIVVAVRQVILFPADTPTGWWHVGQSGLRAFRPGAADPFAFRAGDSVRLRAVGPDELQALREADPEGGGARLEVLP
ncbi:KipI family sensor histidine kinase inhibitor [Defluviimonas denitrificans]|uniref:KipI family sensor histidine kinase inhibitor n=1 Tax=Albidovulum denitrificans TaxID=404881 RepID=A0A2S8S9I9_9RHOB|nr:carboxyltransferase domain-containing protein [Defluviimonas denitrificans]PQV57456.1 KipI family sensor histidine kinase inhibitor [Defluviimonas denitrificans]